MANGVPDWLETMRNIDGTKWAPSDGPNPTIISWLQDISSAYPNMAPYCASVMHDDYFSWCGLTVGYCMDKAGVAPVFGTTDTGRFLWAAAWLGWGKPASSPQVGDVVVFDFGGGDHHVTLFEKDNGDGTWSCHGGNQSHQVRVTKFPKSKVIGVRQPISGAAEIPMASAPVPSNKPASRRFADCIALVLRDEGGNDDDPRDPGGRTSRGIEQREWDSWRQTHAGLPADVWQAPQDQILAIYHECYWSPLNCDALPAGVDYVVFDYGVLSGIVRSAKVLQGFLGADVDGEIGPKTIAAAAQADASTLIKQISDERLQFMQGLNTWPTYGKGWTARVQRVRSASLAMVGPASVATSDSTSQITGRQQPTTPSGQTPISPSSQPPVSPSSQNITELLGSIKQLIDQLQKSGQITVPTSGNDLSGVLQQVGVLLQKVNNSSNLPLSGSTQQVDQAAQLQQIFNFVNGLVNPAGKPLGQVNGALGQTIGNLLDGKKTAIGTIGALITSLLSNVPADSGLAQVLAKITPLAGAAGFSGYAMPVFLAIAAWGALGKLEKWAQGTAPPPTTTK